MISHRKAYVLQMISKYVEVVETYNHCIKHMPDCYEAHFNKAEALVALKRYKEAIDEFDEAIRIDPSQNEAHSNKQTCKLRLKEKIYINV